MGEVGSVDSIARLIRTGEEERKDIDRQLAELDEDGDKADD
jgi:hypothetical protein